MSETNALWASLVLKSECPPLLGLVGLEEHLTPDVIAVGYFRVDPLAHAAQVDDVLHGQHAEDGGVHFAGELHEKAEVQLQVLVLVLAHVGLPRLEEGRQWRRRDWSRRR